MQNTQDRTIQGRKVKAAFFAPYDLSKSQVVEAEDRVDKPVSKIETWGDFHYDPSSRGDIATQANKLIKKIRSALQNVEVVVLFGTFIPPLQNHFVQEDTRNSPNLIIYESWHHEVGERKEHMRWVKTGEYSI